MSKLKRRKTSMEEIKPEHQSGVRGQTESLRIPDAALQRRAEGEERDNIQLNINTSAPLSDEEKLWMETLQALSPHVPAQGSTLAVPQLPSLSTKEDKQHDQCWCSLDEDVIPFPNPSASISLPHSAPSSSSPGSSPSPQNRSGLIATHGAPRSLHQGNNGSDIRACEQHAEGTSGSGAEHSGPESSAEIKSTSVRGTESDRLRLERCPMCLMPFPAEFTQMECDGHLAQCLSEMNVDVLW